MSRYSATKLADARPFPSPVAVLEEKHLMWSDVVDNKNRFYRLYKEQAGDGQYRCRTHYGRVGANGIQEVYGQGRARWEMDDVFREKYDEKTGKGYVELDIIASAPTVAVAAAPGAGGGTKKKGRTRTTRTVNGHAVTAVAVAGAPAATKAPAILRGAEAYRSGARAPTDWAPAAQAFYNELLAQAQCLVDTGTRVNRITSAGIETPLGLLSDAHVARAQGVLEDLARAIVRRDAYDTNRHNSLFFTLIPTPVGRSLADSAMRTLEAVQEKQDVLRAMRDLLALQVQSAQRSGKAAAAAAPPPVTLALPTPEETAEITRLLREERCTCHPEIAKLTPRHLFKVSRPADHAAFEQAIGNVRLLLHGTRRSTAAGVLTRGLLPTRTALASGGKYSGSAFGDGIYWASNAGKSLGYADGGPGHRILFLGLVALGRMHVLENGDDYRGLPAGCHAIHGRKGRRLNHDEFIVQRTSQTALAYVMAV